MLLFILPPGGFFVFGLLIALANRLAERQGKQPVTSMGCAGCPSAGVCSQCEASNGKEDAQ